MNILAIDTSNDILGIALLNEEKIIGEYITNIKKNHSVRVMPAIERLLQDCGIVPAELEKIVVAKGPGSYTGVRIGVTIAKTMAWSLGIPLSGVSSLAVLAASPRYFNGYISPLFDARRGLIYTGLYQYRNGHLETVMDDRNILAEEWAEKLKELQAPVLFTGNDVTLHQETFQLQLSENAFFAKMTEYNPRPGELGRLGMHLPAEEIHSFSPNYIRLVEAEAKWLEKQEQKNDKL
ncbi:tRNA (adenosine(37)-N6)-threonylcarbamoyltransferase complex dimerization subunit type 1 TsaB [Lederbergia citrea]|uniref:tRNA (Adenosine(37)-N6)-threonylcarbamoyltransferase complex dimerization subunit type 1 TsaB n=1 Tax=Lederbergia citrea TaxID=2833581 RepID=A0A942Z5I3_9BACI|nr:tRNA (adenosine(37)-N6)-threonylcarbamoyltransferase complex dimerization subunit type 1 TsaB [Lederbergia citrea]MBS4179609.1 tRNA (adenosine(37)-N6)-threonylcarbamoyltransferase complex dimerization subunit type 1 TsaB [Lederbergia citrea]MBS4206276.1 tRNA (adenosine(37)-N6)-threonylcarbamoyltransferase complex dimerization subunit type 1 TsaB [Lederbergia citrea]MBS4224789.1 tRNA (adenosine(37)-N6)-threonylcarbamoyltransferase complex dimerization subunit type 1 TsaB [Lederbergia citrea]